MAPLFLILLLAWVERGAPRPRVVASAAAAAAALLILAIPFDRFVTTSAVSDTLMLLPWWAIQLHWHITWLEWLAFLGAVAFAAAFLFLPRRVALALPLIVLVYWLVAAKPIWYGPYPYGVKQAGAGALFQGIRGVERDWIDRAVPAGADVAVLWTSRSDRFTVNQNEFFNRSVGQVYYTVRPTDGGDRRAARSRSTGGRAPCASPTAAPVRPGYLLTDGSVEPDADPRRPRPGARDDGLEGQRAARPREDARHRHLPERHVVRPSRDLVAGALPRRLPHASRSRATRSCCPTATPCRRPPAASVHVVPNKAATLRVPLTPRRGTCTVVFNIAPTAVPSEVIPGSKDDRELGAHFNAFAYRP